VSVNLWKGMSYALLNEQGQAMYVKDRLGWIKRLIPTAIVGSLAIFDLRDPPLNPSSRAEDDYNLGISRFTRGQLQPAAALFERAVKRKPTLAEAHLELGNVYGALGETAKARESFRRAIALRGDWHKALNNLAWQLANAPDRSVADQDEAIRLAERACELTRRDNLSYLDTLAAAYVAAGRPADARRVCEEGLQKSEAANNEQQAADFRERLQSLSTQSAQPSATSGVE
jgi:tetratricopeptide (TPR) repeat protein